MTDAKDVDAFYNLLSPRLSSILNKENFEFRLLYRNSINRNKSNNGESFHKHCDGNLNTVTLVQSNHGNIFGGFTTQDWQNAHQRDYYKKDDDAFVFGKIKFKHPPKIFNNQTE